MTKKEDSHLYGNQRFSYEEWDASYYRGYYKGCVFGTIWTLFLIGTALGVNWILG